MKFLYSGVRSILVLPFLLLLVSLLSLVLLLSGCSTQAPAPSIPPTQNLYDQYMAEERTWAGLTTEKVVIREGLDLVYSIGGDQNRPVLVLLHGYYGDRNNWNRVAKLLSSYYRLIIPDLPGHGDSSEHPKANYSIAEMAYVVRDLIEGLGITRFSVAGHSMGGAVALQWAMFDHKSMEKLILMDAAGKYTENQSRIMQQIRQGNNPMRIAERGDAKRVMQFAMAHPPFVPAQVLEDYESKQLARTPVYDRVMEQMLARDKTLDVRFFNTALKLLPMPVLVIWGEQDALFSVNVTEQYTQWLKQGQLVTLPEVGHSPLIEAPWLTSNAIKQFLQ